MKKYLRDKKRKFSILNHLINNYEIWIDIKDWKFEKRNNARKIKRNQIWILFVIEKEKNFYLLAKLNNDLG
jgi:hypothetical protein